MADILKNVVLVGATGNIGAPILSALRSCPTLNVTVVTRPSSSTARAPPPAGVRVLTANYDSVAELAAAFAGAHVVICTFNMQCAQEPLIDAAVAARVRRFIPSEFGADHDNPKAAQLPVFRPKRRVRDYLEKYAREGRIEWTAVANGAFLDWGLRAGFLAPSLSTMTHTIYDSALRPFPATLLRDIGAAVVAILHHAAATRNRTVYIQTLAASQQDYLDAYEKATGARFAVARGSTDELRQTAEREVERGNTAALRDLLKVALYGDGYAGEDYTLGSDCELLGVRRWGKEELEAFVRGVVAAN